MKISIEQLKKIIKEEIANAVKEVKILQDPMGDVPVDYMHGLSREEEEEEEQNQQKIENRQNIERVVSEMFPGVEAKIFSEKGSTLEFELEDFDVFLQNDFDVFLQGNSGVLFQSDFGVFLQNAFKSVLQKALPQMRIQSTEIKNYDGEYGLIVQLAGLEEAKKPSAGMSKKRKK